LPEQQRVGADVRADVENRVPLTDVGLERPVLLGVPRDLPERRRNPDRFASRKMTDQPIAWQVIEHRFVQPGHRDA
jgi:hypothetical protein